jgi:hypothetical protein
MLYVYLTSVYSSKTTQSYIPEDLSSYSMLWEPQISLVSELTDLRTNNFERNSLLYMHKCVWYMLKQTKEWKNMNYKSL